ncbi:hypothetical protein NMY22_g7274 [Coprinellus aureogranulatus]|nr:hypothetical protein NMY22_g7274 [Coprinellus aureogranulatus]
MSQSQPQTQGPAPTPVSQLPATGNASWTFADIVLLIAELLKRKAQAGDGGSFKKPTWTEVAVVLEAARTVGGPKDWKSCKNKWNTLRTIFRHVEAAMDHSGWVWVHGKGANITGDQKHAWEVFLKTHKEAAPFRNKDWEHYDAMAEIMPSATLGKHVFAPGSGGAQPAPFGVEEGEVQVEQSDEDAEVEPIVEPTDPPTTSDDPSIDLTSSPTIVARTPAAITASRKRERTAPSTPTAKRTKMTGSAAAINGLTKSIDTFGDKVCAALAMDPELRTPHRRKQALAQCQKETWLSLSDRLLLYDILEGDVKAVDAYAMIDPEDREFREEWILRKLNKAKELVVVKCS